MSMHLTVYVGPYLVVPRSANIDLGEFDDVVYDGRGEAGVGEKEMYLLPHHDFKDSREREMHFGPDDGDSPEQIVPGSIPYEVATMDKIAARLIEWCIENNVPYRVEWGVVPGFF